MVYLERELLINEGKICPRCGGTLTTVMIRYRDGSEFWACACGHQWLSARTKESKIE